MGRKRIILTIIICVVLLAFLFPKNCGNWGTAIHPDAKYKDCTCIGLKYKQLGIGAGYVNCFGIPVSYSCYYYSIENVSGAKVLEVFPSGVQKIGIACE